MDSKTSRISLTQLPGSASSKEDKYPTKSKNPRAGFTSFFAKSKAGPLEALERKGATSAPSRREGPRSGECLSLSSQEPQDTAAAQIPQKVPTLSFVTERSRSVPVSRGLYQTKSVNSEVKSEPHIYDTRLAVDQSLEDYNVDKFNSNAMPQSVNWHGTAYNRPQVEWEKQRVQEKNMEWRGGQEVGKYDEG